MDRKARRILNTAFTVMLAAALLCSGLPFDAQIAFADTNGTASAVEQMETTEAGAEDTGALAAPETGAETVVPNPEDPETIVCETPAEYTEATGDPDPEGTSQFSLKRLMLFIDEGTLADSHGAISSVYYTTGAFYLLEYETPAATKSAYKQLCAELGDDSVFIDLPVELFSTPSQSTTAATPDSDSASYGHDLMHLDNARDVYQDEPEGEDPVIVAVLDSGINAEHEMFSYTDDHGDTESRLLLYDDANFSSDSDLSDSDTGGHGTHVAGIVADGTPHQVKILPVKLFPEKKASTDNLYVALLYARDKGADIINLSFGYTKGQDAATKLMDPLFRELREKNEIMCVAAAGNNTTTTAPVYPATSDYVEGVAQLSYTDADRKLTPARVYTSGDELLNYAAPGTRIVSAGKDSSTSYVSKSGTSMASPHIAAAMAMVKLRNPDFTTADMNSYLNLLVQKSTDQPAGMYYRGNSYGMPVFANDAAPVPVINNIRNYQIGIKQSSLTYTGKGNYLADVSDEATYSDGTSTYTVVEGVDYKVTYTNCNRVGTATAVVQGILPNLTGSKSFSYRINPAGMKVKKLIRSRKAITVRWKKQSMKMPDRRITGYQIQLATNKKFTKQVRTVTVKGYKRTSKKVKRLKAKKRYYVRVRTYMKVNGQTYYSNWSTAKNIKTR